MIISQSLIEQVKNRCYITDDTQITNDRLENIIKSSLTKVKRMIGVPTDYDFEANGNEEELELFLNYCWYAWNDSSNEFKDNYLDDINSIRHKYEVKNYVEKENIQL